MRLLLLALAACSTVAAQTGLPEFGQFAVSRVYAGPVALPKVEDDLPLRHCVEQRVILGKVVVNFAGRYVICPCTCGTGCQSLIVWDARTGEVVNTRPFSVQWPYSGTVPATHDGTIERYRTHSRLLKLHGCLDGDATNCGKFFYELREGQMILLRTIPMAPPPPDESETPGRNNQHKVEIAPTVTGYSAHVPDLPGCVAAAATLREIRELIRETIAFYIDGMKAQGEPVLPPSDARPQLV